MSDKRRARFVLDTETVVKVGSLVCGKAVGEKATVLHGGWTLFFFGVIKGTCTLG